MQQRRKQVLIRWNLTHWECRSAYTIITIVHDHHDVAQQHLSRNIGKQLPRHLWNAHLLECAKFHFHLSICFRFTIWFGHLLNKNLSDYAPFILTSINYCHLFSNIVVLFKNFVVSWTKLLLLVYIKSKRAFSLVSNFYGSKTARRYWIYISLQYIL